MQISKLPDDYQGAFAPVVYTISGADPAGVVDVEIMGSPGGEVYGVRRLLGGETYEVNIANYMARRVDVRPVAGALGEVVAAPGRSVTGCIGVGGVVSPVRTFTAGMKGVGVLRQLSDQPPGVALAPGEQDEISFIAPGIEVGVEVLLGGAVAHMFTVTGIAGGIGVLVIDLDGVAARTGHADADALAAEFRSMEIRLVGGGGVFAARHYTLVPRRDGGVRLCWVNGYGGVDRYTFGPAEQAVSGTKNRSYTAEGYRVYGSTAEKLLYAASDYEDMRTMEWLAGAVTSPAVWMCRGGEFVAVDVVTSHVAMSVRMPARLEITVREAKKMTFQKA